MARCREGFRFEYKPDTASYPKTLKLFFMLLCQVRDLNSYSGDNALAKNGRNSLPCTFRTFRQMVRSERVGCLNNHITMHTIEQVLVQISKIRSHAVSKATRVFYPGNKK